MPFCRQSRYKGRGKVQVYRDDQKVQQENKRKPNIEMMQAIVTEFMANNCHHLIIRHFFEKVIPDNDTSRATNTGDIGIQLVCVLTFISYIDRGVLYTGPL